MRRRGALLWPVVMAAAAVALQRSGSGTLAAPPLDAPGRWAGWLQGRDPVVAAFSLLRIAGLAALWYLVAVTVAGLALRLAGAARMVALADRLTVAPVRRMLAGVTLSLAATTVGAVAGPATMLPAAVASQPASTTTTTSVPTSVSPATVTMHLLDPADAVASLAAPVPAPLPPPGPTAAVARSGQWTVRPGECFWTIADSVLTQAWGRAPTDAEIVPYWQRLIAANTAALAHPGNPDLIFPGQQFQIPAP